MDVQDELRGLLLQHGPSPVVASFIAQKRHCIDFSSILEETFRRIDLGPRDLVCRQGTNVSLEVEFLLRQGASFKYGSRDDVNKLLEDTYRYIELGPLKFKRRAEACLSPEVDFLLIQGASFNRVPCGLSQLVEATTEYLQQSDQNRDNFLFKQAARPNILHKWSELLNNVYERLLKSVDSETLCHIVGFISRQQKEFKIHTLPFKARSMYWPYRTNVGNYLMDASIAELQQRSDKVTIRAQGREIITFRTILQARSPYFKRLRSSQFCQPNSGRTSGVKSHLDPGFLHLLR
ncbi:hypothetical protein V500_00734 [Pseudogymnoascus sp. VKM F-4518 (FW-2643)]|nr:hypothetical protein V500_00734 [Pseudogymnoascus sp. VKM F-4518 (FW-2643)]